jgi:hypothetical protein
MSQEFEKIAKTEATRAILTYEAQQTLRKISAKKRKTPSVLVLGRDGFSDNSKYLYLAMVAKSPGFPVYWGTFNADLHQELTRRKLPAINLGGDPSAVLAALLEISCVVYCTNPGEATRDPLFRAALAGAYRFQLWHGIGLKLLDLQNTHLMNLLNPASLAQLSAVMDIDEALSPSSLYDDQWREAFGVERVFRAGLPRNEVLLRKASSHELINAPGIPEAFLKRGFILYAPTLTSAGADPAWRDSKSLEVMGEFTRSVDFGLVIKPHPFDRDPAAGEAMQLPPRTLLLRSTSDVYPILRHAGGLGGAIETRLKEAGMKVFCLSRRNGLDVCAPAGLDARLKELREMAGPIDAVVNLAAELHAGNLAEQSDADSSLHGGPQGADGLFCDQSRSQQPGAGTGPGMGAPGGARELHRSFQGRYSNADGEFQPAGRSARSGRARTGGHQGRDDTQRRRHRYDLSWQQRAGPLLRRIRG